MLDLHTFKPREVKDLVPDYLAACQARGILQVRIIHGKGIGNLRRTVHAILKKHPEVISFTLDHPQFGGWGATLVQLRPADKRVSLQRRSRRRKLQWSQTAATEFISAAPNKFCGFRCRRLRFGCR